MCRLTYVGLYLNTNKHISEGVGIFQQGLQVGSVVDIFRCTGTLRLTGVP